MSTCTARFVFVKTEKNLDDLNILLGAFPDLGIKLNVFFVFLGYCAALLLSYRRFGRAYISHLQGLQNVLTTNRCFAIP